MIGILVIFLPNLKLSLGKQSSPSKTQVVQIQNGVLNSLLIIKLNQNHGLIQENLPKRIPSRRLFQSATYSKSGQNQVSSLQVPLKTQSSSTHPAIWMIKLKPKISPMKAISSELSYKFLMANPLSSISEAQPQHHLKVYQQSRNSTSNSPKLLLVSSNQLNTPLKSKMWAVPKSATRLMQKNMTQKTISSTPNSMSSISKIHKVRSYPMKNNTSTASSNPLNRKITTSNSMQKYQIWSKSSKKKN